MSTVISALTANNELIDLIEVKATPWFGNGCPIPVFVEADWQPTRCSYGCNARSVYLNVIGLAYLNEQVKAAFGVDNDLSSYNLSTAVRVNGQSLISDCSGWIVSKD